MADCEETAESVEVILGRQEMGCGGKCRIWTDRDTDYVDIGSPIKIWRPTGYMDEKVWNLL